MSSTHYRLNSVTEGWTGPNSLTTDRKVKDSWETDEQEAKMKVSMSWKSLSAQTARHPDEIKQDHSVMQNFRSILQEGVTGHGLSSHKQQTWSDETTAWHKQSWCLLLPVVFRQSSWHNNTNTWPARVRFRRSVDASSFSVMLSLQRSPLHWSTHHKLASFERDALNYISLRST